MSVALTHPSSDHAEATTLSPNPAKKDSTHAATSSTSLPCSPMMDLVTAGSVAAGLLSLAAALVFSNAWGGSLYLCTDPSGASVLTDSPVQLKQCELVHPGAGAGQPKGPAPARVTPQQVDPPLDGFSVDRTGNQARSSNNNGRVTVPVQRFGHLLIVSTQLNGDRDARLILDTGASHTILSRQVSDDLGLLADPRAVTVTLKTAGGPVEAEVVRLKSLRVSDAEVRNSLVAVYDMPDAPPGVDGLLGLTFLGQFEVTLDARQGLLHLRQPQK